MGHVNVDYLYQRAIVINPYLEVRGSPIYEPQIRSQNRHEKKLDPPQNLPRHSGEIWQRGFVVVVYQPIVPDDPVDLFLGLLEHFWIVNHA